MTQHFGDIAERLRRSTVHVHAGGGPARGSGSGVIWSPEGLIITNAHVARSDRAVVELWDGRQLPATLVARDRRRDLASLKLEAGGLPEATPGDSSALRAGELVIAVGNPLGFTGALSTGVVHALGPVPGLGGQSWVQADIRLLPGNSGGPLADAHGRVVGINTMIAGGLALAVPGQAVAQFLNRGAADVWLGVVVQPVPVEAGDRPSIGLLVLRVEPGSAAAAASLLTGDLLVGVEGRPFRSADDLGEALARNAGSLLHLDFLRGDRRAARQVAVRLGGMSIPAREAA